MPKDHRILVVDDDMVNQQKFSLYLEQGHYEVSLASNGREALDLLAKQKIDLVLMDILMPIMDGWITCRTMKNDAKLAEIPVIFLTGLSEPEEIVRGFDMGAVDFIRKTCSDKELLARVRNQLELVDNRSALLQMNDELTKEIEQRVKVEEQLLLAFNEMEKLAKIDPLTKLDNRRNAMDILKVEESRSKRNGKPYTLIMGDIDLFKAFNDTYGHECGDHVLIQVSKLLKLNVRAHDHVARWGGEEFLIILPETSKNVGMEIAEKIRIILNGTTFEYNQLRLKLSMTFGISDSKEYSTFEDTLRKSDEALYRGKHLGRNVSVVTSD